MNRKFLIVLSALVLVMLAVPAAWFVAADRFEAALDDWLAARQADGIDVHFDARRISGFPFGFFATLVNPSITARATDARPTPWSWKAPELTVGYRLLSSQLQITASGPHEAQRHRGDAIDTMRLETSGLEVTLPRRKADEREIRVIAKTPKLTINLVSVSALSLSTTLVGHRAEPGDHLADAGDIDLDIGGLGIAVGGTALSSASVDLGLSARLRGGLAPGQLKDSMAAWRDEGGTIEISRLALRSGVIDIEGTGTLALDAEMRPMAAFATEIQGYDAAVDQLVADGQVSAKNAGLVHSVLAAMAAADAKTGNAVLALPISAQDGWLYVGPARLAKLPPLVLD